MVPKDEGPGGSAAHPRICLPLLPSGPDGVHKLGLRWTWPITNGGDDRTRTDDPLVANEVLSQLSYIPTKKIGRPSPVSGEPCSRPGGGILAMTSIWSSRR